jgi:hypothetical protein
MVLGQILTKYKNVNTNGFVTVTDDRSALNNRIPTLIVGKENAKAIIGEENMKYLDRKVDDKTYWTFGKDERRDDFESDISKFNDMVVDSLLKQVKYLYINVFAINYNFVKRLLTALRNKDKKTFFVYDDILYMYYKRYVFGISLRDTDYIGIDRKRIFRLILSNRENILIKSQYAVSKDMRTALKNSIFLVPYIYFLEKEGAF